MFFPRLLIKREERFYTRPLNCLKTIIARKIKDLLRKDFRLIRQKLNNYWM